MLRGTRLRSIFDGLGAMASIAVIVVGVLLIVSSSDRGRGAAGAGSPPGAAAASDVAMTAGEPVASPEPTADGPLASADGSPTPGPLAEPTPAAPKPTRTPTPVVDPRPEGTPHYHFASGHLGETIVNDEITIRVDPTEIPATYDYSLCTRADPTYTEALAFKITESWTRWAAVDWTFEMGNTQPIVNWSADPLDYGNGQSNVLVACHRPGASSTIVIYSGPRVTTDVAEDYEWTIR
jgi:hypothetical protein